MGLTQKILLFAAALVVALSGITLAFTTYQANRLATQTIDQGLRETRDVWATFQADRFSKLKLGIRVLGNDAYFKAAVETGDQATVLDTLGERNQEMKADFVIATDPEGRVVARTDKPTESGEDLSQNPLVLGPLEGEESETIWRLGDRLYHAVSVPMQTGPSFKGVLIASYGINETLANDIRRLTHSEIAYLVRNDGQPPMLAVSTLGPKEAALRESLANPAFVSTAASDPFDVWLADDRYVAISVPLQTAGGDVVGSVVALRSVTDEMRSFAQFRQGLIAVSLGVMVLALAVGAVAAARITGPVRRLVDLVERARDGSYSGAVAVESSDEIGTLARAFSSLLADLREKDQMIDFLRDGMTLMKKGVTPTATTVDGSAATVAVPTVTTVRASALERGSVFAGRYEVLGILGKGGMGVVYRANDRQLDEVVALKVLRPEVLRDDPTLLDRFKQEIKLARRITHRNVLRTHDFGETDGTPYISMEYLEGVTLKDLVQNRGALPVGVGLGIAKQACWGIEAAHREGVVHRDIKPQNMLILPESGELKVMDFGIARVSEVRGPGTGLTTEGTVMGTPDYMPPEQAQGQAADFRSDIYSLGVVLFEIFTGQLPFKGETAMAVVVSHIQTPPPKLRSLNPALPLALEAVVLRCLEKEPTRRFASMDRVLEALTAVSAKVEASAA
jgi:HAMP domain-containing protein/predicted Ser/Thr protein kinase